MKTIEILLICFFILLMGFALVMVRYGNSEGSKCTNDPLTYYEKKSNDNCACFCSGQLYAGENYRNNLKQDYANENNIDFNFFNKSS